MAKKIVRLTEGQLHKVISESVKRILREMDEDEIAAYEKFENEMLNDNDIYQKVFEIADNNDYPQFPIEEFLYENFNAIVERYIEKCDVCDKKVFLKILDYYEDEIYRDYVEPFADDYYAEEYSPEDRGAWQYDVYKNK